MIKSTDNLSTYKEWFSSKISDSPVLYNKTLYLFEMQLKDVSFEGKRVLEVGCGKGELALYIALCTNVKEITALDEAKGEGSPINITQTLKDGIVSTGPKNIIVEEKDIIENSFPADYFDIVIANNSLHHVVENGMIFNNAKVRKEYIELFCELKRLLKPSGILLLWEYSRLSIWRWSPIKPTWWREIDWYLHPTLMEWVSVIRASGLSVQSCRHKAPYALRKFEPVIKKLPAFKEILFPTFYLNCKK